MILNTTVEFYNPTPRQTAGNEGIQKYTYDKLLTTRASVQPAALSEAQLKQWGIQTLGSDSKHVFIPGVVQIAQSSLMKDLGTTVRYQVRGSNPWIRHTELIVEPYQGGAPI